MTKIKVKKKITTLKVVEVTTKAIFITAFLSTWFYVVCYIVNELIRFTF